ncbi:MAG: hypothetical protein C5B43_04495 [Verrucomicrobia bacterium]|nr:MAG: hypothetical protein C5B43_04495 [Verrucomicrobiota bacterium]
MNSTSNTNQDLNNNSIIKSETHHNPENQNEFHNIAETNLKLIAEGLQAYLTKTKTLTLEELNTISAIIHKYTTSYTQLKSVEFKNRELYIQKQTPNSKSKTINSDSPPSSSKPSSNSSKIAPTGSPPDQNTTPFLMNSGYGYTQDWAKPYPLPPKFYNLQKKTSAFF